MTTKGKLARGVTLNWVALGFSLVVAFFLSPFVVHSLGNVVYGVWTLVVSMISYMGLLDLGLRGAVMRYVSRHHAQGDHQESSRKVSATLWLRLWIGLLIVAVCLILSALVGRLFRIPPELVDQARWALILTGFSFAVTLTFGVFGGVLSALYRFDLLSAVTILQTLTRALGVVWLLKTGHGIVALAMWELVVVTLSSAALLTLCRRVYPELRFRLVLPEKATLRELWTYSFYVCVINIAVQVIYYTDNLVVAGFISAAAVTFYAIGGSLIEYLRQLVSALTTTFTPVASDLDARGRQDHLQQLLIQGTRAAMFVALPVELALFFRGTTFINLWMGNEYGPTSGLVLRILLLAQFFAIANLTSGGIAYGLAKHKPVALWSTGEAVANLCLSIFLVRRIGIFGVAWGTVIPALAIQLGLWPRYVCGLVEMPVRKYLWQSWLRPLLALSPYGVACLLIERYWHPATMIQFFLQIAAVLPLAVLGIAVFFWNDLKSLLQKRFPSLYLRMGGVARAPLGGGETEGPL